MFVEKIYVLIELCNGKPSALTEFCNGKPSGRYPDTHNCDHYYVCGLLFAAPSRFVAADHRLRCVKGHFNPTTGDCDSSFLCPDTSKYYSATERRTYFRVYVGLYLVKTNLIESDALLRRRDAQMLLINRIQICQPCCQRAAATDTNVVRLNQKKPIY